MVRIYLDLGTQYLHMTYPLTVVCSSIYVQYPTTVAEHPMASSLSVAARDYIINDAPVASTVQRSVKMLYENLRCVHRYSSTKPSFLNTSLSHDILDKRDMAPECAGPPAEKNHRSFY
jgi:hypothetical protein